ncbi:MAG: orotidine-5'-phosphate decarboxylase [Flavobacteriales bacterium]|nr:orotidine-5'-phosphate decarboxylase [Flavobacteriales bacterium]
MNRQQLFQQIRKKRSFLCIGLDTDIAKIPDHLMGYQDPIYEFNKRVIDATHDLCVAYKPNTAFYEAFGFEGWLSLEKTVQHIPDKVLKLADAKRGDIGNTTRMYARGFFNQMNFDAITLSPYMGSDSVLPYFQYEGKWVVLLALTSNEGAADLQYLNTENGQLFESVLRQGKEWGTVDNTMFVVGATKATMLKKIRKIVPDHFLLVPGVGAQGGSLTQVAKYGLNDHCGLLVNSSRAIIYASKGEDFAEAARAEALILQQQMEVILEEAGLL